MSRIDDIKAFAQRRDYEQLQKEKEREEKASRLIGIILNLRGRIGELLDTATACLKNGIKISCYSDKDKDFVADSISHRIGFFMVFPTDKQVYTLCIKGGGCCGQYDFYTDGIKVYEKHRDNNELKTPSIYFMEKFVNGFDEFERRFYEYVDSVVKG